VWTNTTAATGSATFAATDVGVYPISLGQTLRIYSSAYGFQPIDTNFTISQIAQSTDIFLTPLSAVPTHGNWNLVVTVADDQNCHAIYGATVTVLTGVSGPGLYTAKTDNSGTAGFTNISASSSAGINIDATGYQSTNGVIPVFANTTQHVTFQLKPNGAGPSGGSCSGGNVVNVTPTQTGGGGGTSTITPTPTITDVNGNPITSSTGLALYGLDQLFAEIPAIARIVAMGLIVYVMYWFLDLITMGALSRAFRRSGGKGK
jgi:hypothetical protein